MRRSSEAAAVVLALGILLPACNGTEEVKGDGPDVIDDGASREKDFWLEAFRKYMTPEFQAEYLATPEEERFSRHRAVLHDFHERDRVLSESKIKLTQAELEEYQGLPDAAACRAYIEGLERQR